MAGKIALGRSSEATSSDALKAALAEFIATFLFVFLGVGSCVSYGTPIRIQLPSSSPSSILKAGPWVSWRVVPLVRYIRGILPIKLK